MLPSESIGTTWRTLANFSDGGAPTRCGFRVDQFGMRLLQRLETPPQRVVVGVGKGRRVLLMVTLVVFGELRAQAIVFGAG